MHNFEVEATCSKCGCANKVGANEVKLKDIIVSGEKYMVTYMKCSCGNDIMLQVDNDETKKLLNKCKATLRLKIKAKHKGKHFDDKKNGELVKNQQRLKFRRYELAAKLHALRYYDCESKVDKDFLDCSYIMEVIKNKDEEAVIDVEKIESQV